MIVDATLKKSDTNYKIMLIITEGCEGCVIQHNLIKEALTLTKRRIKYTVKDVKSLDKEWLKETGITDFPTTLLLKDNKVVYKFVGTRPAIVIFRYIDVNF